MHLLHNTDLIFHIALIVVCVSAPSTVAFMLFSDFKQKNTFRDVMVFITLAVLIISVFCIWLFAVLKIIPVQ